MLENIMSILNLTTRSTECCSIVE